MAYRLCDGTDPNLTRQVPEGEYDPAAMTLSAEWQHSARPGCVVILCQCRLYFDDAKRTVTYPHELLGQGMLPLFGDGA